MRTGATADGSRFLTTIDLDGKCPCSHNQADHRDKASACQGRADPDPCGCAAYAGVDPDVALRGLLDLLPRGAAVVRTARGFHIHFWTATETPTGVVAAYGAEIYGDGQAIHIPPSRHPSGATYAYIHAPGRDLPQVDLAALGLMPSPERPPPLGPTRRPRTESRSPADPGVQAEFRALMGQVNIRPNRGGNELVLCPFHPDAATRSLHVDWGAAIFHCFATGCAAGGGLRDLRQLAAGPMSLKETLRRDQDQTGSQLGGSTVADEATRLAGALREVGENQRAQAMDQCRNDWRTTPYTAFVCPNGDAVSVQCMARSCEDPQCPKCMPARPASDWRRRWRGRSDVEPEQITIAVLTPNAVSDDLDDRAYLTRVRNHLGEWRKARHLAAGFYALTIYREGDHWRARLLVAVSDSDACDLTDGRAFSVEIVQCGATAHDLIAFWQRAYLAEATAWTDTTELVAYRAMVWGRRKYQGWGKHFGPADENAGQPASAPTPDDPDPPLHRVSGGSGSASRKLPRCPRCGEKLKGVGRFDPDQMEIVVAGDGLKEWRWRERRAA